MLWNLPEFDAVTMAALLWIVGVILAALFTIWLFYWANAPAREIRRAKMIERLWREREIFRARIEKLTPGSDGRLLLSAIVRQIDDDLRSLGVPQDALQ